MYEGFKFKKIEEIVLYAIAKERKPIQKREIYSQLSPEINPKNIDLTLRKLQKKNLIKMTKAKKEENVISLNIGKLAMMETKKRLKEHWESNWEAELKN